MGKIKESIKLLITGNIDYEFRTTVVRELHSSKEMEGIAELILGAKKYFLQQYVDRDSVICPGFSAYSGEEMEAFLPIFEGKVGQVSVRGVD